MSRSSKQPRPKRARRASKGPWASNASRSTSMWIKVGFVAAAAVGLGLVVRSSDPGVPHPTPRENIAAAHHVQPASRYAAYSRVADTYSMAAAVPYVLDGLYCYCHCSGHSSHYSLLECFQTDHAARCDICMSEAVIAYEMSREGASLDAIRDEADRTFGT